MNKIRATQQLNKRELEACTPPNASWHTDFRHTAFVYVGGLQPDLSEGDIVTIFSQYGEPVYVKLIRDKFTGKSKGFAFLKYEDQRSCDLAVDNLGGADVLGRKLRVDHAEYKPHDDEEIYDNTGGAASATDAARMLEDEERERRKGSRRPQLKEERELLKLEEEHDAEDPMKAFILDEKREEVRKAVKRWERDNPEHKHKERHSHRSRRDSNDKEQRRIRDRTGSPRDDKRLQHRRDERSRSPERRDDRHGRDRRDARPHSPDRKDDRHRRDRRDARSRTPERRDDRNEQKDKDTAAQDERGRRKERSPTPKRGDPKARGETPIGRSWRDKIPTQADGDGSSSDDEEDRAAKRKEAEEERRRDASHERKYARY